MQPHAVKAAFLQFNNSTLTTSDAMSGSKDNNNNKASDLDRSGSVRSSARVSTSSALDDDDDYDLEAAGISDGFRPTEISQNHQYTNPQPLPPHLGPAPTSSPPPRPSSITKPHRQHDSLTLRHDGATGPASPAHPQPSLVRTPSASTSMSGAVRPESPYEGPSGPSFPYQMYPQNVRLARTASVATASTAAVSEVSSYRGPRGPTHPYQMYPQNTVPGVESTEDRITPAPIPVGFPGAADQYQRRIGPDGEEIADMIGPDGHTEQLPPYTRYPDEAYLRKAVALESPAPAAAPAPATSPPPPPQSPGHASSRSIPGAGGLGLATRNPEFASTEDLHLNGANSPLSRNSVRSFQSDVSHHDINTAAMSITNEKEKLNDWQKAAKRKVWGVVPCWAIVLTAIVLVMLAVVLGAILGTFFGGKHQRPGPSPPASR